MTRRGRPRLADDEPEPSRSLHVRLSVKQFDALCAEAQKQRITVNHLIRRCLDDDREPKPTRHE